MEPYDYGYGILTALSEVKLHVSDKNSASNKSEAGHLCPVSD